ncbi:MAG: hypothetical protein ACREXY_29340 [Gammaproteobacteria bacterium]
MLDFRVRFVHGLSDAMRDEPHLTKKRLLRLAAAEIHIVDVAARAVRYRTHERRILPVGAKQLLDAIGEHTKVIRGNDALNDTTAIVQRIIRQQRQRLAICVLQ